MSKRTLPLFTIDDTPYDQRNSDASVTRGGRIKDKIPVGRVICQTCGFPRTLGLPCPTCARIENPWPKSQSAKAGGQPVAEMPENEEITPISGTFSSFVDTE